MEKQSLNRPTVPKNLRRNRWNSRFSSPISRFPGSRFPGSPVAGFAVFTNLPIQFAKSPLTSSYGKAGNFGAKTVTARKIGDVLRIRDFFGPSMIKFEISDKCHEMSWNTTDVLLCPRTSSDSNSARTN